MKLSKMAQQKLVGTQKILSEAMIDKMDAGLTVPNTAANSKRSVRNRAARRHVEDILEAKQLKKYIEDEW